MFLRVYHLYQILRNLTRLSNYKNDHSFLKYRALLPTELGNNLWLWQPLVSTTFPFNNVQHSWIKHVKQVEWSWMIVNDVGWCHNITEFNRLHPFVWGIKCLHVHDKENLISNLWPLILCSSQWSVKGNV